MPCTEHRRLENDVEQAVASLDALTNLQMR
jgi:hypothetical protein